MQHESQASRRSRVVSSTRRSPLSVPDAADYAGLSLRHLRRLIQERRVAHYKVGGRIVISPDDLDSLLEQCRREALR